MRSDCCNAEMSAYIDEEYNKIFYTCLDCGCACSIKDTGEELEDEDFSDKDEA